MTAFLITGRTLANYRLKGDQIQPGFVTKPCLLCQQPVTLSLEGAALLAKHLAAGEPGGAVCTPCALTVSADEIRSTRFGTDLVERRDDAKAVLDFLMKRSKS